MLKIKIISILSTLLLIASVFFYWSNIHFYNCSDQDNKGEKYFFSKSAFNKEIEANLWRNSPNKNNISLNASSALINCKLSKAQKIDLVGIMLNGLTENDPETLLSVAKETANMQDWIVNAVSEKILLLSKPQKLEDLVSNISNLKESTFFAPESEKTNLYRIFSNYKNSDTDQNSEKPEDIKKILFDKKTYYISESVWSDDRSSNSSYLFIPQDNINAVTAAIPSSFFHASYGAGGIGQSRIAKRSNNSNSIDYFIYVIINRSQIDPETCKTNAYKYNHPPQKNDEIKPQYQLESNCESIGYPEQETMLSNHFNKIFSLLSINSDGENYSKSIVDLLNFNRSGLPERNYIKALEKIGQQHLLEEKIYNFYLEYNGTISPEFISLAKDIAKDINPNVSKNYLISYCQNKDTSINNCIHKSSGLMRNFYSTDFQVDLKNSILSKSNELKKIISDNEIEMQSIMNFHDGDIYKKRSSRPIRQLLIFQQEKESTEGFRKYLARDIGYPGNFYALYSKENLNRGLANIRIYIKEDQKEIYRGSDGFDIEYKVAFNQNFIDSDIRKYEELSKNQSQLNYQLNNYKNEIAKQISSIYDNEIVSNSRK